MDELKRNPRFVESSNKTSLILCCVDGEDAYFTTRPLSEQWGDDWNDAPYEHNAGPPYRPIWHNEKKKSLDGMCWCERCQEDWNKDGTPKYEIVRIAWYGPLLAPCDGYLNSPWSVQAINRGKVPWLRSRDEAPNKIAIYAGASLCEFREKVTLAGGTVTQPLT